MIAAMAAYQILWAMAATALLIAFRKQVQAALDDLNNRRGGPRTPMHPSPAMDDEVLRRRKRL
jgi:hypothetical protein